MSFDEVLTGVGEHTAGETFDVSAQGRARAIFLHSGWRSRGTWLWDALRAAPGMRAFYEPLHEGLAEFNRAALEAFRPDSWGSGHGGSAPYFAEYAPLLNARGRGVSLYRERFAFGDYFLDAAQDDAPLRAYLDTLLESARREGRLPVLKFSRSHGRVAWLMRHYPEALHAVVLRDPVTQWRSCRRQALRDGNAYFLMAPYMILARNAEHPFLADILRRLDVTLPPRLSQDPDVLRTVCERHVQTMGWAERYRGFLALWVANAVAALSTGAMLVDADHLDAASPHRRVVEAGLGRAAGQAVQLGRARPPGAEAPTPDEDWPGDGAAAEDAARAALRALEVVAAHRAALGAARTALLSRKLAPRFAAGAGGGFPALTAAALPPAPAGRRRPETLRALDAAAYVAYQRATWPLRRLHYHLDRWLRR